MNEKELVDRIDKLKVQEEKIRRNRQDLEIQLLGMVSTRIINERKGNAIPAV